MKLDTRGKRELAARFVMGSMHGAARRRFVKMMQADAKLRLEVKSWHQGLMPWSKEVRSIPPPPQLWQKLETSLGFSSTKQKESSWGLRFWQALSSSMAVGLVVLSVLLLRAEPIADTQTLVLVLNDKSAQSGWVLAANRGHFNGAALRPGTIASNQDYELWVLPPGLPPKSMGLLDQTGRSSVPIYGALSQWIKPGATLAVSLEPVGGSPTGLPTGPVLYTGEVLRL